MTQVCWFCGRNESDPTRTVEVPLFKEITHETTPMYGLGSSPTGYETTWRYVPAKVVIPRCQRCAKTHGAVDWFRLLGGLVGTGLVALYVASAVAHDQTPWFAQSNWSLVCLFFPLVGLFIWLVTVLAVNLYLDLRRTRPLNDRKKHPEVVSLVGSGYAIGKSPAEPTLPEA